MCVHGAMKGTELRREETATNVKCNPGNPAATAAFSASIAICNGSTDSRALVLKPRSRFFLQPKAFIGSDQNMQAVFRILVR